MRPTASSTSSGNGAGSNSGQGNVEDFDTFRARQAVSRTFAKQDAAYLAMADDPDYAGMLLSSAGAGGSGTSSGFGAVSNYAGGSLDTGWGAFSTQFTFKDQCGAQVDYLGVIGNSVGRRMTADQARAYDLDQYYSAMRNGDLPTVQSNSPGIARNIGAIEGFFTFNSVGRFLKGYGEGAYNLVSAPFIGTANLVKDGYGFAKQRIFGPEVGVMGDTRPYDPQSGLVRSFMTKGGLATAGDILHGAVMSTPIGTLNALYHGNPEEIGASLPGTFVALSGTGRIGAAESLASRNVWKTFNDRGIDLGGGGYGPNIEMVAQVLESGNGRYQTVANALRSGELALGYGNLADGVSGRYFPGSGELTLNGNMNWSGKNGLYNAAITAAHEGQHWLDDVAGIAGRGMKNNEMYFEARAFLSEQKLANSLGRPTMGTLGRLEAQLGSRTAAWEFIKG